MSERTTTSDPSTSERATREDRSGRGDAITRGDEQRPEPASTNASRPHPADDLADDLPRELRGRLSSVRRWPGGGQGRLYRGRWADDGRLAMVKIYGEARHDRSQIWPLWRDAATAGHAVELIAYGTLRDGQDYEVTAYHAGGSLEGWRGRPMSHVDVERVLTQVGTALDYFHHQSTGDHSALVHGDVKPANILVTSEQPLRVCLTDFGAARVLDITPAYTMTATMTPEYAAPEQHRRRPVRLPAVDWWALGMTVLELLQGRHPFEDLIRHHRVPGERSVEEDRSLEAEIEELLHNDRVPIDESVPDRWRRLCEGLLTRNWRDRWAYPRIQRWLAGEQVPVNDDVGPGYEASREFEFAGEQVTEVRRLAALMAANWNETARLVAGGPRWHELVTWVRTARESLGDSVAEVGTEYVAARRPVDRAVAELLVRLDPAVPPSFRGFAADSVGLRRLADEAVSGDTHAAAAVESLLESGGLRALSRMAGQSSLDALDERWREWWDQARTVAGTVPGGLQELPSRTLLPAILLSAALDPAYRTDLAARARRTYDRRTRRVGWFRRMYREAMVSDAPPRHAVMILAVPLAREPQLRVPDPGTELAQQAQRLRAEVDTAIARAGPAYTPDTWLPAPGAPHPPVARRLRTAQRRSAAAGVGMLVAAGYTVLVATAGIGVGSATTAAQGALTAVVLLLAGGCLVGGLLLPRSALSEGLLGAVTGAVAGLGLACLLGAGAGLLAGPVVGWPVFWVTWVAVIVVGTARGAAEWTQ